MEATATEQHVFTLLLCQRVFLGKEEEDMLNHCLIDDLFICNSDHLNWNVFKRESNYYLIWKVNNVLVCNHMADQNLVLVISVY